MWDLSGKSRKRLCGESRVKGDYAPLRSVVTCGLCTSGPRGPGRGPAMPQHGGDACEP